MRLNYISSPLHITHVSERSVLATQGVNFRGEACPSLLAPDQDVLKPFCPQFSAQGVPSTFLCCTVGIARNLPWDRRLQKMQPSPPAAGQEPGSVVSPPSQEVSGSRAHLLPPLAPLGLPAAAVTDDAAFSNSKSFLEPPETRRKRRQAGRGRTAL